MSHGAGSPGFLPSSGEVVSAVSRFFASLHLTLAKEPLKELKQPIAVRFALGIDGSWLLRASPTEPGSARLEPHGSIHSPVPVDCTVTCKDGALLKLASGQLKPAVALLKGLLSVSGTKSVFMSIFLPVYPSAPERKKGGDHGGSPGGGIDGGGALGADGGGGFVGSRPPSISRS